MTSALKTFHKVKYMQHNCAHHFKVYAIIQRPYTTNTLAKNILSQSLIDCQIACQ